MPLFSKKMKTNHNLTRSELLNWIRLFNSIPNVEMFDYLPYFLESLFSMINDQSMLNFIYKLI
jgi:hypothetical protein